MSSYKGPLPHACEVMVRAAAEAIYPISYVSRFREYALELLDLESQITLTYCPFCGAELPESLREQWFATMDELGVETILGEDWKVPKKYLSDLWWRESEADE